MRGDLDFHRNAGLPLVAQNVEQPLITLLRAVPLNFYAVLAVIYVFYISITGHDWGPMGRAERRARETGKVLRDGAEPLVSTEVLNLPVKDGLVPRARNMLVPLLTMLFMMPIGLLITGKGNWMEGSGTTAVLWAVMLGCTVAAVLYLKQGMFTLAEIMDLFFKGIGGLMPLALLMMFAFAIGATCSELQTGVYAASLAQGLLSPALVPLVLFWLSGFIAFSTGTSWGTFAIMLPIGIPVSNLVGTDLSLTIASVLAGGVFGDHCSPISDTTIISSMASGSDHIDHVKTQFPYAFLVAIGSSVLFLAAGYIL